ncbi:hypothetical protein VC83_04281 [Pseudogymnoascus destructans]|uniref:Fungal-type protein kinase domain-containing protein n=1 Tax=Pseudogymnoascus destructans TaxID=655981 RepID=A0A177ADL0_9PEZI|nr:uncharacterized protein VC83_04281 [Pseudogymnoascus destructans]OAF59264.1 hypothetical protein VC83_04281 [Pseudogymnoascus destructans]
MANLSRGHQKQTNKGRVECPLVQRYKQYCQLLGCLRHALTIQLGFSEGNRAHDEVDQRILEELTGCVYNGVGGFIERYFEGKIWMNNTERYLQKFETPIMLKVTGAGGQSLQPKHLAVTLRGSEADCKLDIFLSPANVALLNGEHDWSNVLVIGPHEDGSTKTLLQLAGYAREVLGSQPDRRFVPGFTICGSVMRLWVFHRSGPYSSEKFDIHKEPEWFVQVIAGYALMTDAELGLNTFIRRDGDTYIITQGCRVQPSSLGKI